MIKYAHSDEAWRNFKNIVLRNIQKCSGRDICDIGGGANPLLSTSDVDVNGVRYSLLDISQTELDKAVCNGTKIRADICDQTPVVKNEYDLVFSNMLAEHVADPKAFHRNVFAMLKPGGLAIHFFPTMYAPPFLVNRLVPETVAGAILDRLAPRDRYQKDKFPAYYRWCRGPSTSQLNRLRSVGFNIVEYNAYFGHKGYYTRVKPLLAMHEKLVSMLIKHPVPSLTSFSIIVLQKPH
ncbi:MAG: methyltransferase domain-containing protein [Aquabacterium sp.]